MKFRSSARRTPQECSEPFAGSFAAVLFKELCRRLNNADFLRDCRRVPLIQRDAIFAGKAFRGSLFYSTSASPTRMSLPCSVPGTRVLVAKR